MTTEMIEHRCPDGMVRHAATGLIFLRVETENGFDYINLEDHPNAWDEIQRVIGKGHKGGKYWYQALVRHGRPWMQNKGGYYPLNYVFLSEEERIKKNAVKPRNWLERKTQEVNRLCGVKGVA